MKSIIKPTIFWLCLLSGIGLLFIGIRFFLHPFGATLDYGINIPTNEDFSFQYIKGIRDFSFGIIILVLLLRKQWQALGWVLLFSAIIPAADFFIVISHPKYIVGNTIAHLIAVVVCVGGGCFYLKNYKILN